MNSSLITVRNLTHTFGDGAAALTVLHGINLDFDTGEIVIIMGPSGSGKTTLLTLIAALRSPQSGSVVVCGTELCNASARKQLETRQRIGYIFQTHNLLDSLNACENVQMGIAHLKIPYGEAKRRALKLLKQVGLEDHSHKMLNKLSGGQRQRVAIARALVREPAIIIADEPTASLDKHTGQGIVELLGKLTKQHKCLVVMVTHDSRILDVADRILTLEDGYIDESNFLLDRTKDKLIEVISDISTYTRQFKNSEFNIEASANKQKLEAARRELMTLGSKQLKESLANKFNSLDRMSSHTIELEDAVKKFCLLVASPPTASFAKIGDSLLQGAEFQLLTTEEAMISGDQDDIEDLLLMSCDKSDLIQKLRAKYSDSIHNISKEEEEYLFDITQSFSMLVYFVHNIAECL